MRLRSAKMSHVLPILLIVAIAAAALVIVCQDGVHSDWVATSPLCTAMTHVSGLASGVAADSAPLLVSGLLSLAVVGAILLALARGSIVSAVRLSPATRPDPLNGRLRI